MDPESSDSILGNALTRSCRQFSAIRDEEHVLAVMDAAELTRTIRETLLHD
jgi:hypothetical protein